MAVASLVGNLASAVLREMAGVTATDRALVVLPDVRFSLTAEVVRLLSVATVLRYSVVVVVAVVKLLVATIFRRFSVVAVLLKLTFVLSVGVLSIEADGFKLSPVVIRFAVVAALVRWLAVVPAVKRLDDSLFA